MTVWRGGWSARLLAVLIIPELVFDMYLNLVYVKGIIDLSVGRQAAWKHLKHSAPPATAHTVILASADRSRS